ncbi:hypothetical protein HUT18_14290 [Streptomyces sp. NA04227]|uniref:hypothetical protein n=1 Tax=Streptomyces sp. NA04227 TaxID=2742136 RepID=UPI00159196F7|nr:hypothetical protein [Streptomyces sp. NA04227]QKW07382.1 hypothetical protein HUT18_14290 [Streptomyces sp. NA04227]
MSDTNIPIPLPGISLMAAAELRDALTAIEEGKAATAVAALLAIDPESWQVIEKRLVAVIGADLRQLLTAAVREPEAAAEPPLG